MNTNNMTLLELYKAADVPLNKVSPEDAKIVFKAARVLERRRNEWFKSNPEKGVEDFYNEWFPGGYKAWEAKMFNI
jgi:hypothetical protein